MKYGAYPWFRAHGGKIELAVEIALLIRILSENKTPPGEEIDDLP